MTHNSLYKTLAIPALVGALSTPSYACRVDVNDPVISLLGVEGNTAHYMVDLDDNARVNGFKLYDLSGVDSVVSDAYSDLFTFKDDSQKIKFHGNDLDGLLFDLVYDVNIENSPIVEGNAYFFGKDGAQISYDIVNPLPVPVPAAAWLFASGLAGLVGFARHKKHSDKLAHR